jgi:23S rRNA pseudouridine1911/1915/1917 synthase
MTPLLERSVAPEQAGVRLDRFLATAQADLSRSRMHALIVGGRVRVNDRPADAPALRLRAGDRVVLDLPEPRTVALAAEDLPLNVVHRDDDLLVIDKPAGLVVHPGAGNTHGTLVHALLHHDPAIAGVGGAGRPGIVHRLDKDTSGLMVVARSPAAYRALVEDLRVHAVRRVYHALVWGSPRERKGVIEGAIGRDPRHRQRMAVVKRGGKPAVTRWRVLEAYGPVTLLELTLETGRTHQIRVHLAHSGWPVVGDPVYGGRGKKLLSLDESERSLPKALLQCLPRQALHAVQLQLKHPASGRVLEFESAWPHDFGAAVELLRAFRSR